ncbi:hypothetical protein HJC23_002766 [Cyclotella cryptica]|uniref:Heat shock protein 70 n=1 Tax=Cyclotella cryptica TaxID=29204 RepID=A0ABD3PVZ5_9STRA
MEVFDGECSMMRDNNLLSKFNIDDIPPMPHGQQQIDVCFDINANGILNVSALETSTGKENKITIIYDKGHLSQEEIERMVQEVEKYKAEDDVNKSRVESKNGLENCCYSLKSSIKGVETAEKEESEEKKKALKAIEMPILQNMASGGGGMPDMGMGGMPDMGGVPPMDDPAGGPTIVEID